MERNYILFIILFVFIPIQSFSQVNGAKPRAIIDINSLQRIPDRYIVTYVESQNKNNLKATIQEITQEIAAASNSQILKIYDSALIGSALYNTNQSSIELLYSNPNVHKIYADLNVILATTQVSLLSVWIEWIKQTSLLILHMNIRLMGQELMYML